MTRSVEEIANAYIAEAMELSKSGKGQDPAVGHEYYDRLEQESDAVKLCVALKTQDMFEVAVELYSQMSDEDTDVMVSMLSKMPPADISSLKRSGAIMAKALGDKISPRQEFAIKASQALPDKHPDNAAKMLKIYRQASKQPAMK